MFECFSTDCGYDGFNYHSELITDPYGLVFEYDCYGYNHGKLSGGTGNVTTAHDGIAIIRVNSVGHDSVGPVLADVNGCDSLNIDCTMYDSLLGDQYNTKSAYYFDAQGAQRQGGAWLINSGGGGNGTWTVNTDGNIPVYVNNLKGNNIPDALELNYLD